MAAATAGCYPACLLQAGRANLAAGATAFRRSRIYFTFWYIAVPH